MKTITIPKSFGFPTLDIVINNEKHTLKSGVEITIDDRIAEVIENAVALAPKYWRVGGKLAQIADGSIAEIALDDLRGVKKIVTYAFAYCTGVKSIVIPDSVESIEAFAFFSCSNLENIRFESNSKSIAIGTNVFDWCAKLKSVYLPEIPPTLANVNAFANVKTDCIFYCKTQESLAAYKSAPNWSALTSPYTFAVKSN